MPEFNNYGGGTPQNNNSDQKKSVSTSNMTYYNPSVAVPSALSITYYDDAVRIQFSPELPKDQQTEKRKYDYQNSISTLLTRAKCNELCAAYKDKIIPALVEGRSEQVSVPIAYVHQLMIDTNPDEAGTPRPRLLLIKNIDQNTLIASDDTVIAYEFNTGEYILGYNHKTGEFKERVVTFNELKLFMHDLEEFESASSNAYVHTERVVNRYWKDTLSSKIDRIGEKNGLDFSYRARYGAGNGNSQASIFTPKTSETQASGVEINDLSQLDEQLPFN